VKAKPAVMNEREISVVIRMLARDHRIMLAWVAEVARRHESGSVRSRRVSPGPRHDQGAPPLAKALVRAPRHRPDTGASCVAYGNAVVITRPWPRQRSVRHEGGRWLRDKPYDRIDSGSHLEALTSCYSSGRF
jgi:hypothetical protein